MWSVKTFNLMLVAATIGGGVLANATQASAVSSAVQYACMSDYFTFCSQHSPNSPALRKCMQSAGPKLSKTCVDALTAAGEVPRDVSDRRTSRKNR